MSKSFILRADRIHKKKNVCQVSEKRCESSSISTESNQQKQQKKLLNEKWKKIKKNK